MAKKREKHASKIGITGKLSMVILRQKHASISAKVAPTRFKKKQKKTIGGYFGSLPCETLHKIALMLPFTSIIQLRRSSKFWYNRLTEPKFIDLHLTRALQKPPGYLFNPNIVEEVQVRDVPIFKKCRHWWFFCYSPSTKEYKILKLGVLLRNNLIESTVGSICTVGSNIWREIQQNIPHQFFDNFAECRGNLFWMKKRRLIWFDLVSEEFHEIPGPLRKGTRFNPGRDAYIGLKRVRLVNMGHTVGCIQDYRLWLLEDITKGIWIKRHEFPYPWSYKYFHLVGVLEDGRLFGFVERSTNVFSQDIGCEHITSKNIDLDGRLERIAYVGAHVRSFVSPVRIMEMGNKQVYDHCDVHDVRHKRKWVLDTLKLGDDATEDDVFHRMYEVLNLQPQLKGQIKGRKLKKRQG